MLLEWHPDFFSRKEIMPFLSDGLLIDTGPLILLLVGEFAQDKLIKFEYNKYDYEYLKDFLGAVNFKKLVITPHIFHELYKRLRKEFDLPYTTQLLVKMKERLYQIEERYVNKTDIINCEHLHHFDIGEHSLYLVSKIPPSTILTDDSPFVERLKGDETKLVLDFGNHVVPYMRTVL